MFYISLEKVGKLEAHGLPWRDLEKLSDLSEFIEYVRDIDYRPSPSPTDSFVDSLLNFEDGFNTLFDEIRCYKLFLLHHSSEKAFLFGCKCSKSLKIDRGVLCWYFLVGYVDFVWYI